MKVLEPGCALALALERGRGRYNARVAQARREGPLDLSRLARALADDVAPAVQAVAAALPRSADTVAESLFDLALELSARDVLGAGGRHPGVEAAWRELLPRLARHLAEAPRRVAAAITNAALHLESMPGVRPAEWRDALGALADACPDATALLAGGQVLAWRAGAAHWRESALRVWDGLPAPLARAALGLPSGDATPPETLRGQLTRDPFRRPGAREDRPVLRRLGRVGGFRGFGGPFLAPPRLVSDGARLWAIDGEDAYALHADCFGAALLRAAGAPGRSAPGTEVGIDRDGTVTLEGLGARFADLAGARAAARAGALIAVLPRHSHLLALVARTTGADG